MIEIDIVTLKYPDGLYRTKVRRLIRPDCMSSVGGVISRSYLTKEGSWRELRDNREIPDECLLDSRVGEVTVCETCGKLL